MRDARAVTVIRKLSSSQLKTSTEYEQTDSINSNGNRVICSYSAVTTINSLHFVLINWPPFLVKLTRIVRNTIFIFIFFH